MNVCRCEHGEEITLGYGKGLTGIERDYPLEAGVASFLVRTGEISKININATGKGFSTRKSLKVGKE